MGWMRMMGADSVAYHRETIIERADDFPQAALEYFSSRGETPLVWGGSGAESLGLAGAVDNPSYDAVYGPGGARDPATGERLVSARRPGMELVIAAHKSVAELGVLGRAEDMHAIMDAERDATLGYLDEVTRRCGGRRGVAAVASPTAGLVYAHTRHATTRAGDPGPHDHVLLANVIEMKDAKGGTKAPDTTLWREHLHAATMVGRLASSAVAVRLGYGIEADPGPSGKLGHWKIVGIPDAALAVHSKRSKEIADAVSDLGFDTYQARGVAARETRKAKRHEAVGDLVPKWRRELTDAGFPPEELADAVDQAGRDYRDGGPRLSRLSNRELSELANGLLGPNGAMSQRKVFSQRDVIVATAPALYGRAPAELDKVTQRVLRDPDAIALVGVPRASERAYATATVLATEQAIEWAVARGVENLDAAKVTIQIANAAAYRMEEALGVPLTDGQKAAVEKITTSGRQIELVEGVAGSGKTTVMAAVRDAFEAGGFTVVGTSTSGQAARTLGREAGIEEARTLASLLWRIENGRFRFTDRHVLVVDEAGMASDRDVAFLLDQARLARTKVVMVGDDRQLGAVALGGSMGALVERHGGAVHSLCENVRQRDLVEREALADLRAGELARAIEFYLTNDRVVTAPSRDEALHELTERWARDVMAEKDAAMFAWRRANVAELNRLAREKMAAEGRLTGPELHAPGGRTYAAGDRIMTLAATPDGKVVTSERGVVMSVDLDARSLTVEMDDGRRRRFEEAEMGAAQLDHGYATTVHRSQGATCDVSHVYEDGGGREVAYVAMSRARECSHVYVAADDLDQAREDLVRNWANEHRWRWAIDTGTPATEPESLRREALLAERHALLATLPRPVGEREMVRATEERRVAARDLKWLREHGGQTLDRANGRPTAGELGLAWDAADEARWRRRQNERNVTNKDFSRKSRREARERAVILEAREQAAEKKLAGLFEKEERRLTDILSAADARLGTVTERKAEWNRWFDEHPSEFERAGEIRSEVFGSRGIDGRLDHERQAVLHELNPPPERTYTQEVSRSVSHDRSYDREPPDLGFGL